MTDLTQEKVVCLWRDAKSKSFMALKVALSIKPVLHLPDFEKQSVVTAHASDVALGAILEQNLGSRL